MSRFFLQQIKYKNNTVCSIHLSNCQVVNVNFLTKRRENKKSHFDTLCKETTRLPTEVIIALNEILLTVNTKHNN
jgi:hypothetical protein